jgi:ferrous iron transport protein A
MSLTLDQVKPGQTVKISSFLDQELAAKLLEMGCLPGQYIRMISSAPLGDPVALVMDETMLSMRKAEACCITVEEIIESNQPGR